MYLAVCICADVFCFSFRPSLHWNVTWCRLVGCRRLGTTYRFHLHHSGFLRSLKMDMLPRNVGKQLQTCVAKHRRRATSSTARRRKPETLHSAHLVGTLFGSGSFIILCVAYRILCISKKIYSSIHLRCGPGSVVGLATGYGLDGPRIESRWGRDFPHLSRPALGPAQPPVQWVLGLSWG